MTFIFLNPARFRGFLVQTHPGVPYKPMSSCHSPELHSQGLAVVQLQVDLVHSNLARPFLDEVATKLNHRRAES